MNNKSLFTVRILLALNVSDVVYMVKYFLFQANGKRRGTHNRHGRLACAICLGLPTMMASSGLLSLETNRSKFVAGVICVSVPLCKSVRVHKRIAKIAYAKASPYCFKKGTQTHSKFPYAKVSGYTNA